MKLISLHKNYASLIKKAKKDNRKAQHALFELFAPKMKSVCRQYMKDEQEAEDVMLKGFQKVFTRLDSFSGEGSFEGWIRRIMVHESIDALRKRKVEVMKDEDILINSLDHAQKPSDALEVEDLQRLIDALPSGYKAVFILYVVEGYKHSEIAEMLGISEGTSKSQLSKARQQLQEWVHHQNKTSYGTE
ncbi:RNA polymerase sigma factor [Luteirhabdus pelagi]|uniref:RNA polymerase sigma factor n=1 Tax=Luteirhabdus pelagi TaxID=2792783 RepID=UPI0019398A09|nr:RNA polymerase sigma factor [Luteirhabdus pelagi]